VPLELGQGQPAVPDDVVEMLHQLGLGQHRQPGQDGLIQAVDIDIRQALAVPR
jgi:hypothetical protein